MVRSSRPNANFHLASMVACGIILLSAALPLHAKFTWEGCADFKDSEFRYVKVVTRALDPTLEEPLKLAFDARPEGKVDIYFVERHGKVKRYDAVRNTVVTLGKLDVYSDSPDRAAQTGDTEHGLNGIALDPDFKTNHFIYLFYPPWAERTFRLSRFTVTGDQLDMNSEKVLLSMPESRNHPSGTLILLPGGALAFDAYGDLWVTIGADSKLHPAISETDWAYSAEASSANLADLRGSVLRIHPDNSAKGYSVPKGNLGEYWSQRFAQEGKSALATEYADPAKVLPEIYVKGTRNPYTVNVDPWRRWLTWGDYGPNQMAGIKVEELNLATAPSFHGFPYYVGKNINLMDKVPGMAAKDIAAPLNTSKWNKGPQQLPPVQPALYTYANAINGFVQGNHPTAGPLYRYQGSNPSTVKLPPHFEKAWFIAERTTGLRVFKPSETGAAFTDSVSILAGTTIERPLDLKQGPDGALYIVDYGNGWHATSGTTHIGRVEYSGPCRPLEPNPGIPSAIGRGGRMGDVGEGVAGDTWETLLANVQLQTLDGKLWVHGSPASTYSVRIMDWRGREAAAWIGSGDAAFSLDALPAGPGLYVATIALGSAHRILKFSKL